MTLHDYFNAASISLTIAGVTLTLAVLYCYGPRAIRAIKETTHSPVDLLIMGITISFMGSLVDNLYWGVAWTADYFDWEVRDYLFTNGVYWNVFDRQTALILAAYLHILAARKSTTNKSKRIIGQYLKWSWRLSGLMFSTLIVWKSDLADWIARFIGGMF